MVDRDMIEINYFLQIKKEPVQAKGKMIYSKELKEDLFKWMAEYDPLLLKFIQIFTYGMIRPIEAVRLKVKDFNIPEGYFYANAKQKSEKKKVIPKMLLDVLPDISHAHPEQYVITKNGVGFWEVAEMRRREYFSNRFSKMRKELGFDRGLKLYNFRHTIISNLYVELRKVHGKRQATQLTMEITGHSSEQALLNYLVNIDAYLPEDFSKYLE